MMQNEHFSKPFLELLFERLENRDGELPVFDTVALQLHKAVNDGDISSPQLSDIIEKDPVMVADIIRMSNSSFYAGLVEITNLNQAVVRLGMRQIASLVMCSAQKRLYSASKGSFRTELIRLWEHASAVGFASRWIALNTQFKTIAEDVFVAGMLHDIGKLDLLMALEGILQADAVELDGEDLQALLTDLHPVQGVVLLNEWNMPQIYKDVVQNVESEEYDNADVHVRIVRLADRVCTAEGIGYAPQIELTPEQWEKLALPGWSEDKREELIAVLSEA